GRLIQDTSREFEALQQPVLLIWGTQALEDQRNIASLHDASQLRRAREVELIQGAGLAVHTEQPESVVAAMQRWLAKVVCPQLQDPVVAHGQSLVEELQQATVAAPDFGRVAPARPEPLQPVQTNELAPLVEEISRGSVNALPSEPDKQHENIPQYRQVLAYCVKCKAKTEMLQASEFTMKNGRLAVRGTCVVCGSGLTRIGGLRYD
ncbi:MAG: DUF5679 domain-containing protein, partial [Ktedonobacteraceae bacterium]